MADYGRMEAQVKVCVCRLGLLRPRLNGGPVCDDSAAKGSVYRQLFMPRVSTPLGKSWIFFLNSRTWKVMENHFGPGKSWKLMLKVLKSPGKISLKVMHHIPSGSNGTQAAMV